MHKAVLVGAGVALLVMPTISPAHARTIAAPACTGLIPRSAFPTEMRRFLRVSTMRPQDYQALSASWREVVTYRWGSVEQDVIVAKTRVAVRTAYGSLVRSEGRDMTGAGGHVLPTFPRIGDESVALAATASEHGRTLGGIVLVYRLGQTVGVIAVLAPTVRITLTAHLAQSAAATACRSSEVTTRMDMGGTQVYADARYGYTLNYPASWSVQRRLPMYVRALKRLSRTGTGFKSPDQNAWALAVVGRGTYSPTRLRTLERDALTQMVQTAGSGITYASSTVNGARYQLAHTYGQWYDYGNHIAIADQLFMATSHGPYTYVFAISVKLRTPSTAAEEAQATTLIKSLVVRYTNQ